MEAEARCNVAEFRMLVVASCVQNTKKGDIPNVCGESSSHQTILCNISYNNRTKTSSVLASCEGQSTRWSGKLVDRDILLVEHEVE